MVYDLLYCGELIDTRRTLRSFFAVVMRVKTLRRTLLVVSSSQWFERVAVIVPPCLSMLANYSMRGLVMTNVTTSGSYRRAYDCILDCTTVFWEIFMAGFLTMPV